jgi:hypothetical protein
VNKKNNEIKDRKCISQLNQVGGAMYYGGGNGGINNNISPK